MSRATAPRDPADRILARLAEGEGVIDAGDPAVLRILTGGGLKRMRIEVPVIERLVAEELVFFEDAPAGMRRFGLTPLGCARLRRMAGEGSDFRRQHGEVTARRIDEAGTIGLVDEAESPLSWLARRRDKDGRVYLTPARVAAGERLRADFTVARMMPAVTSNWSTGRIAAGHGASGGIGDLADRALAARDRVRSALEAVGRDLADVLLDVCCFLKGLETIEADRRWPARSAKVVLDIALGRLAAHYGLADEARGPDRARALRAWGTGDHRPEVAVTADRPPPPVA
ncbi:MAG: DUF6456 domain-containing protein [Siculibacillus sp.]|nr:DUF6456 domain-containing protein [Siculibacillus sp.]